MVVTKRFIKLICLGAVLILASYFIGLTVPVFILFNTIAIVLLAVDYFTMDNKASFEIERVGRDKLSIFEREEISFSFYNKADRSYYIEMKDEVPDFHFEVGEAVMSGVVGPHHKQIFNYRVTPKKRGVFKFHALHVRYEGRFKLCRRQFKVNMQREYKVYPNLNNLKKYRLLVCKNKKYQEGQRLQRMLGRGTSFESLREYVNGDEYRKINWSATARENKPIVNQYEPEKNQHVHILIDTGRTMSYTLRGNRKLDMAVNTALVLSDIVNENGDQSALMVFNTAVQTMLMPGKGVGHRSSMMEALYHVDYTMETSNYEEAFFLLKKKERHRSIVFLFTDFDMKEEAEEMLKVLPIISKNNVVVLILIKNEKLEEMAQIKARDKEQLFDKAVAIELLEDRRKLIKVLNKLGIMCVECKPEEIELAAINKYMMVKNRNF